MSQVFIQHPGLHEYMNCPSRPARGNISASNQQEEEQKPKLVRQELILAIWYYVRRRVKSPTYLKFDKSKNNIAWFERICFPFTFSKPLFSVPMFNFQGVYQV